MKRIIICFAAVAALAGDALADQDHVECPGTPGSPYYEYPDIGVCARYDNGTACPTGFTGMALESNEGWGLDGWGCFCQTGYTSPTTGACIYAPVNPGYTDCDRDWERNFSDVPPSPVFIGVCNPDCDYWGDTCDTADWVHNDTQVWVGPDMLMVIDRDEERMVVYDQYPDFTTCGLIGWVWHAATSSCVRACDHPDLSEIPCPNAGIGWFHFGWSLTPPFAFAMDAALEAVAWSVRRSSWLATDNPPPPPPPPPVPPPGDQPCPDQRPPEPCPHKPPRIASDDPLPPEPPTPPTCGGPGSPKPCPPTGPGPRPPVA